MCETQNFMGHNLEFTKHLLLFATPLVTSYAIAVSPTFAATLSLSAAALEINNLSHKPLATSTFTNTQTLAIAENGLVAANANADAVFKVYPSIKPSLVYNSSTSIAVGEGSSYFGLAQSVAAIAGYDFGVKAGETFSFDFAGFLALQTSIDNQWSERASARGKISLQLYDSSDKNNWKPLDCFTISGLLKTSDIGDYFGYSHSENIAFNPQFTSFGGAFGGRQESLEASLFGNFSRTFNTSTNLTLLEVKENQVTVESEPVPEPSSIIASLLFLLTGLGYKFRSKAKLEL